MANVITYQLAYLSHRSVSLCEACVESDDHDCGSLGPVKHGLHNGQCRGAQHGGSCRPVLSDDEWLAEQERLAETT
jgi:hypothetical protein